MILQILSLDKDETRKYYIPSDTERDTFRDLVEEINEMLSEILEKLTINNSKAK